MITFVSGVFNYLKLYAKVDSAFYEVKTFYFTICLLNFCMPEINTGVR